MKKITVSIISALILLLSSCNYGTNNLFYRGNSVNNRVDGIQDLGKPSALSSISDTYSIVVVTDVHFGGTKDEPPLDSFFAWLDSKKAAGTLPKMCLSLGDDADHGYEREMQEYRRFMDRIESYGIPVFNTVGNHDLYNSGWDIWKKYACTGMVGQSASAYKFRTNNFSFYSLDSGTTVLGSNQLESLESNLEGDSRPKIVFSHYPIYIDRFLFCMEDSTERNLLIDDLARNNVKLYLAGHVHLYDMEDFGSFQSYALPSFRYDKQWTEVVVDEKNTNRPYTLSIIN